MQKLEDQEINVKKLYRKGNITKHVEDHSGFLLVVFSIYHCFFFLDLPLVMADVDPIWP